MDASDEILVHLREMVGPEAEPRPNQLEAIEAVAVERERLLLVQRTGGGKSAVYFIVTRMLRDRGASRLDAVTRLAFELERLELQG